MARKTTPVAAPSLAPEASLERLPILFPLCRLSVADENPRSDINDDELDALKESISANGILMPLIAYVSANQFGLVTVGGRRLRALRLLAEDDAWDTTALNIPVIVMDRDEAVRAGVTEQLSHVAMSDKDVLRAFTTPYFAALSNAECAKHMGLTAREVAKRRRILELPDEILTSLWQGEITPDQAIGLTYFIDQPEILGDFWTQATENADFTSALMREEFSEGFPDWDDFRPCSFITEDAYRQAGGRLQADLFRGTQIVLDPEVAEAVAEEWICERLQLENTARDVYFLVDGAWPTYHHGILNITDDEILEYEALFANKAAREANPERYNDLHERRFNRHFPDELLGMLDIAVKWLPPSHSEPFQVYRKVLPREEADREPLYAAGFSPRPKVVTEAEKAERETYLESLSKPKEPEAKNPLTPNGAVLQDIEHVLCHAHRQVLIQDPQAALAEWLKHLASRVSVLFSSTAPQGSTSDLPLVFHKDWIKAAAAAGDDAHTINEYKPSFQKLVVAWRVLSCLTTSYNKAHALAAGTIRQFFAPDDKWMARYTSAQLSHMLGAKRLKELTQATGSNPTKNALVKACVRMAQAEPDWLPLGFPSNPVPKAAAPAKPQVQEPMPYESNPRCECGNGMNPDGNGIMWCPACGAEEHTVSESAIASHAPVVSAGEATGSESEPDAGDRLLAAE